MGFLSGKMRMEILPVILGLKVITIGSLKEKKEARSKSMMRSAVQFWLALITKILLGKTEVPWS